MSKAKAELDKANKQMEKAQASTAKAIQGHIDRINATKPSHEMRLLEQAVLKLGGSSKLTKDQLSRVTMQVNALAAAGAKVPASLSGLTGMGSKLSAAFASLTTGGGVSGALAAIGPAGVAAAGALGAVTLAGGFAVRQIADLAGKAEEWSNLAASTGLGTKEVQQLGALLEDAGIPAETLSRAMKNLHREIADGGKGLKKYGIDLSAVKDLTPEEQLQATAQAILNIQDANERGAAAQAAFGRAGETLIPVLGQIAEGGYKVIDALGDKQVAALAKTDAAFDRLSRGWTQTKQIFIGGVVEMADAYNTKLLSVFGIGTASPITESLADFEKRMGRIRPDASPLSLGDPSPEQKAAVQTYQESQRKALTEQKKAADELLAVRRKYNDLQTSIVKGTMDEAGAMRDLDEMATSLLKNQEKIAADQQSALKGTRLRGGDMLPSVGGSGLWTRHQDVLDQEMENAAAGVKEAAKETKTWEDTLGSLADQLNVLASTTGGLTGKIVSFAASLASGLGGAIQGFKATQTSEKGPLGLITKIAGSLGAVGAVVGVAGSLIKGFKSLFGGKSKEQKAQEAAAKKQAEDEAKAAKVQAMEARMQAGEQAKGFAESLNERIAGDGLTDKVKGAVQGFVAQLAGALGQLGIGVTDARLKKSESFQAVSGVASDVAGGLRSAREAGIVDQALLGATTGAAVAIQEQAIAAAQEAGLEPLEAAKQGSLAIAGILREQLNASIQSGTDLDANTQALLDEARKNGINIMADPLVESLGVQREMLGALRSIAGQGGGEGEKSADPGAVPAARGFGPMITPNVGGGLGPRLQTHPGEMAMVIPRSKMGPGALISAADGLFSRRDGGFRRRRDGSSSTVFNLMIAENPFQSSVGAERLRRYTLKTVERHTARNLAARISSGLA